MRFSAGVLIVAVVLGGCQGTSQEPNSALQARLDSFQTAAQTLERRLQAARDSLRSKRAGTALTPHVYFPSGSAWIPDEGRRRLDAHARTLRQEHAGADFRIRGYTDPVPIGDSLRDTYPSNWYLAAQRAAAVAHYLDTNHDVRSKSLRIEAFGPPPTSAGTSPQRQPKERRVEIIVEDGRAEKAEDGGT